MTNEIVYKKGNSVDNKAVPTDELHQERPVKNLSTRPDSVTVDELKTLITAMDIVIGGEDWTPSKGQWETLRHWIIALVEEEPIQTTLPPVINSGGVRFQGVGGATIIRNDIPPAQLAGAGSPPPPAVFPSASTVDAEGKVHVSAPATFPRTEVGRTDDGQLTVKSSFA